VLQDDGHLFRVLREQPRRQLHAFGGRQEGDEEMMLAGQAVFGGIGQHAAKHPAQRIARQHIITDMIGCHGRPVTSVAAGPPTRPFALMLPRQKPQVSRRDRPNCGERPPGRK
jgi:hypothetical protein